LKRELRRNLLITSFDSAGYGNTPFERKFRSLRNKTPILQYSNFRNHVQEHPDVPVSFPSLLLVLVSESFGEQ